MMRGVVLAAVAALALAAARTADAQSDPRLLAAVRSAQEGQGDSARAVLGRLLAATPTADTLYPQILYSLGLVAADVSEREPTSSGFARISPRHRSCRRPRSGPRAPISTWGTSAPHAAGSRPASTRAATRKRAPSSASRHSGAVR